MNKVLEPINEIDEDLEICYIWHTKKVLTQKACDLWRHPSIFIHAILQVSKSHDMWYFKDNMFEEKKPGADIGFHHLLKKVREKKDIANNI